MTVNGSSITIDSTVSNTGTGAITGAKLTAVLVEDLGTAQHHYVVRDILTPAAISSLSSCAQQTFTQNSTYGGDTTNLKAVLFVRSSSGPVMQAVLVTAK